MSGSAPGAATAADHPLLAAYGALIAEGVLDPDPAQAEAAVLLSDVARALERGGKRRLPGLSSARRPVPGLWLWGEVGRGKTMLMDLLVAHAGIAATRRVHFHEFMDEVHDAIAAFRRAAGSRTGRQDPIPAVTRPIAAATRLLCLDEFHVTDITNAMLLGRLFEALFAGGVTLVATSNLPPDGLYRDGLNRPLVLPFIALLKEKTTVFELKARHDYRHMKCAGERVFAFGPPETTRPAMDAIWRHLTGGRPGRRGEVHSLGRAIPVPVEAMGVARFSFAELCDAPLGARDYLRLAETYHSFVIDAVPVLDRTRSDAARRFILLVDTLYDRGATLAAGFGAPLDRICADGHSAFEFRRTLSRLAEMQSAAYLAEKG